MGENKMALLEYVEPINIGSIFMGIGSLIVMCVFAYVTYRFYIKITQFLDVVINKEAKYEILQEAFLDNIAKKKGIDLTKELVKRKMFENTKKRSIRKRIEDQIYEDMFGKETINKKE